MTTKKQIGIEARRHMNVLYARDTLKLPKVVRVVDSLAAFIVLLCDWVEHSRMPAWSRKAHKESTENLEKLLAVKGHDEVIEALKSITPEFKALLNLVGKHTHIESVAACTPLLPCGMYVRATAPFNNGCIVLVGATNESNAWLHTLQVLRAMHWKADNTTTQQGGTHESETSN